MKWSIGIDPGFGESGLVLCKDATEPELVEWVTWTCPPSSGDDVARAVGLSDSIVHTIVEWINTYDIAQLDVAIELPVYTRNAAMYCKQVRLLEEIESGVLFVVAGLVEQCYLTEVYPTTSKSLLCNTSQADKYVMIENFQKITGIVVDGNHQTKHTVADAYAHSLATWMEGLRVTRMNLTEMDAAIATEVSRGNNNG